MGIKRRVQEETQGEERTEAKREGEKERTQHFSLRSHPHGQESTLKKKNHSLLAFESQEEHFSCLNHEPKGSVMVSEIGGCQNLSLVLMR